MTIEKKLEEVKNKGLLLFGIILLVMGLVASFYQEQHHVSHVGDQVVTPYQSIGIVLVLVGAVFIALAFFYLPRKTEPTQQSTG